MPALETKTDKELSVEEKTRVNPKIHIYKIPVEKIVLHKCLTEPPLQGYTTVKWLVEAKTIQEAVLSLTDCQEYWKNYNNSSPEVRQMLIKKHLIPFRISLTEKIEEVPDCKERHKTKNEDYVCGPPMGEDGEPDMKGINGEYGDCICQNAWTGSRKDLRECCPYRKIFLD